jgi:hypothetical protein
MKKKIILVIALSLIGTGVFTFIKYQNNKNESISKVNHLTEESISLRSELIKLYQERHELLFKWQKLSKLKLPEEMNTPSPTELNTEQELKSFDLLQNKISTQFNLMLKNSEPLNKKILELQAIEESINRKRNEYHTVAFEALTLIQKYNTKQPEIPLFPAEKMLRQMQK